MSQKITNDDGEEVEVFTADEVAAREAAARATVEGEYKPKLEEVTTRLTEAQRAAAARASEFAQFRKLNEDQVLQLSEKDRVIYENQLALQQERDKNVQADKMAHEHTVATAIRAKVGNDESLFTKVKEMYGLIGLEEVTPEQISRRVTAAFGALGQIEPNLLATAGFAGGSFEPPKPASTEEKTFADSDQGKALANDLGLVIEQPKK